MFNRFNTWVLTNLCPFMPPGYEELFFFLNSLLILLFRVFEVKWLPFLYRKSYRQNKRQKLNERNSKKKL